MDGLGQRSRRMKLKVGHATRSAEAAAAASAAAAPVAEAILEGLVICLVMIFARFAPR